jgi:hypothetical protein
MPRTSGPGPADRKISGENCRTISSRGRTHCPSGRPALMASWLIARRWDGIWGAKRSHSARTIPPLSWARANRRGTNRNGCAPSSAASRSTGTASASAGSWARTRVAETRRGSSDVSLASNSSVSRWVCDGAASTGSAAAGAPAPDGGSSGPLRALSESTRAEAGAAGTAMAGRRAASRRGSIDVTLDVAVVAPRGRFGATGGLSNIGLPTVTEASTGLSTSVRPAGAGNGGVLGEGTGRRPAAGWGAPLSRSRRGTRSTGTQRSSGSGAGGNDHVVPESPWSANKARTGSVSMPRRRWTAHSRSAPPHSDVADGGRTTTRMRSA